MSVVQVRDCETAADVLQRAREVEAKRRAGRIPAPAPAPVPPLPPPVWVPAVVRSLPGGIGEWANEIAAAPHPRPTTGEIIKAVAKAYGFAYGDLVHPRRDKELVHVRHVSMLLCKILTKLGDRRIAWAHGRTDHSTVLHVRKKLTCPGATTTERCLTCPSKTPVCPGQVAVKLQAIHVPDDPPQAWAATAARIYPLPELSDDYVRRLEGA